MIYYFSTTVFLAIAGGYLSLARIIYRRAARNVEVKLILLLLLFFSLQSLLLFFDALMSGVFRILLDREHELLIAGAGVLQTVAFAAVARVVSLTHLKALEESERLSNQGSMSRQNRDQYRLFVLFVYLGAGGVICGYARRIVIAWLGGAIAWQDETLLKSPEFFELFFAEAWLVYSTRILALSYQRRAGKNARSFVVRLFRPFIKTERFDNSILHIEGQKTRHRGDQADYAVGIVEDEWRARLILFLWLVTIVATGIAIGGPADMDRLVGVLWFALPSIFVLPLIYYKMRFVFFDVVIKRGLSTLIFLVSSAFVCGGVVPLAKFAIAEKGVGLGLLAACVGSIVYMACWHVLQGRLTRFLDRRLFRRCDYGKAISNFDSAIKAVIDSEGMVEAASERLRAVVDANQVKFVWQAPLVDGSSVSESSFLIGHIQRQLITARIPVATAGRCYGHLEFGNRQGGFPYQSEDLAFMTTAAGHLAEMLHNLELRSERETQRQQEQELRALATQAELRALRAQINPHFLFNALNGLAELTHEDPRTAEVVILHLASVFRYALDSSERESVTLDEELSFVQSYLIVERLRFEDKLRYRIDVSAEARSCRIPAMIIQPVVENAVKHGISRKIGAGTIEISAFLECGRLLIRIEDDGIGFDPASLAGNACGVGLENVRSRLQRTSGRAGMKLDSVPGRGTRVLLDMPMVSEMREQG